MGIFGCKYAKMSISTSSVNDTQSTSNLCMKAMPCSHIHGMAFMHKIEVLSVSFTELAQFDMIFYVLIYIKYHVKLWYS